MNLELSIERAVVERTEELAGAVPDPGAKPDDRDDEQARRLAALTALRAAMDVEDRARELGATATADRAAAAMWAGASLADLAGVTGHSRQAARKRWPGLGDVHRRRYWLGHHVDEAFWAARLVVEHRKELRDVAGPTVAALAAATDEVSAAFTEVTPSTADPAARWRALDALVDQHLRPCVESVGEPGPEGPAGFAVHGARGVVAYYDHALGRA